MSSTVRAPAVSGRFYPGNPEVLLQQVKSFLPSGVKQTAAIACVVPHAGYIYSGHVAGAVYSRLDLPQHCIVMCPNHTGRGEPLAIMSSGAWETPLGQMKLDHPLAEALKEKFNYLQEDPAAHRAEHAIEVQIPFLQVLAPGTQFVPIAVGTGDFEPLEQLGNAIAEVLAETSHKVLIIASSDMNHYENDSITRVKDGMAVERILALDARGLFDTVVREKISMCGFGPTVAMLTAARRLGAKSAELIKYATSGDVSGDRDFVVGYAGIVIRTQ